MVEDALVVDGDEVGHAGPRPGGHDDVVGRQLLDHPVGVDHHLVRALQLGPPVDHPDLLRRELRGDRLVQTALDRGDPLAERVDVEVTLRREAHGVRPVELDELTTGRDQRLRGDAVPQVGGTADDVALDERHVGAQRRRDARARVARGATTQDHETRHRRRI